MVKSLLKLTQPFIHNEPFTLHAIFETSACVPQVTNNKQSQKKSARSKIASLLRQPIFGVNSCVNID